MIQLIKDTLTMPGSQEVEECSSITEVGFVLEVPCE